MTKLYKGDCLEVMKQIPDKSVDMILCDLPYGTVASAWDKRIPMKKLWEEYERLIKPKRAIVLFAQQPFTTLLISSKMEKWKYNWIWEKDNGTNFLNSHFQPMKVTEDICVFGDGSTSFTKNGDQMIYNPQYSYGKPYSCKSGNQREDRACIRGDFTNVVGHLTESDGKRFPKNLIRFNRDKEKLHPTQKPVALCEYLIKTYTNEGDLVLDNCMGCGSTGVACKRLNRNFIGIELDDKYFEIAKNRIEGELL